MPGPIEATGAVRNPTRYGALGMGARQFTGLWTQRSPYRDAAVEYLVSKFYSGSRFDSILDGINREISQRLTDPRRPGSTVYNSNSFPPIASFYPWKYIQNGAEVVRVVADGTDGTIYDATAGQKSTLMTKAAGAGPARFLGVNTELFITDGVEQKKILRSAKTWQANTVYTVGDFILDSNGNIQSFQSQAVSLPVTNAEIITETPEAGSPQNFLILTLSATAPVIPSNQPLVFAGMSGSFTFLNSIVTVYRNIANGWGLNLATDQIAVMTTHATEASAAQTGTIATNLQTDGTGGDNQTGTSGGTQPTWGTTPHGVKTQDGTVGTGVTWTLFGSPLQNWQVPSPAAPPAVGVGYSELAWPALIDPLLNQGRGAAIIDSNGQLQVAINYVGPVPLVSGPIQPIWNTSLGGMTVDGAGQTQINWMNAGKLSSWYPSFQYALNIVAVIDTNGNLQVTTNFFTTQTIWTSGTANTTGATDLTGSTEPTWNTTLFGTTTDGSYTWTNYGPATQLTAGTLQYSYSYHSIDGSVTTAAPVAYLVNPIAGLAGFFQVSMVVPPSSDASVDQIWLWRTAGGQATLVFLDQIPNVQLLSALDDTFFSYSDVIPDTSTNGGQALIPQIPAPIADSADPPPLGMTAPVYHLNRIWAILGNTVVYSGGPDTITGNGDTAFPPLNEIPYPAQPIRLIPVTVQNGGLLVLTTDGVYIILGTGTASNPFYTTSYYPSVSITGYNAVDVFNNAVYQMESNLKVSRLAIEYPFNPQTGYEEVGFPIGDQFVKVTTGGISTALYDPAAAYLSWCVNSSADTGMYVADGAVGWFRMSFINPPESGALWSPRAAVGTSAVQNVETSPGIFKLLIGSASAGPILMRDTTGTTWTDNGTPYPAWDVKGVNLLCSTGQWTEVAHISSKSAAVGTRPIVSVLLGEIAASTARPWNVLKITGPDPPDTPKSVSVYSDRYDLLQNGVETTTDCISTKFDYGTQAVGDELLDWGIYATTHDERTEEAAR